MVVRRKGIRTTTVLALLMAAAVGIAAAQQSATPDSDDDFDLDTIITQVTSSKALGFLTKLSLKRDIDRLLDDIKKYHGGKGELTLEQLHERYDALVHNLVSLLQDKDEELVKSIDDGRDKLWVMLADEKKFATL